MNKRHKGMYYTDRTMFPVYIGICFEKKAMLKELRDIGIKEDVDLLLNGDAATHHFRGNNEIYIVYMPKLNKKRNQIIALLTHEITHITDWLFQDIGEKEIGMETRAYLMQFIMQDFLYAYDDYRKKKK